MSVVRGADVLCKEQTLLSSSLAPQRCIAQLFSAGYAVFARRDLSHTAVAARWRRHGLLRARLHCARHLFV